MNLLRRTFNQSLCLAALMAVGACATTPAPTNVADTAARRPELSTLNKLIAEAGLTDTLRGAGPYTVFAPSDEAFKALPAKTLAELSSDKALLKSVLSYHMVAGKLSAADVKNSSQKSLQGANLALAKAGSYVTVEDALVQQADVPASNGVVHVIDKVLMPPKR